MEEFSGVRRSQAVGQPLSELLPFLQGTVQLEDYREALEAGMPFIAERKANPLREQIRYMRVRLFPLQNVRRKVERALTLLEDITEIAKIEEVLIQRNAELAARNAVAATISQHLELSRVLQEALSVTLRVARLDVGSIYLYDPRERALVLHISVGLSESFKESVRRLPVDQARIIASGFPDPLAQARAGNQGLASDRPVLATLPPELAQIEIAEKWEGVMAREVVPLISRRTLQGLMIVGSRSEHIFTPAERDLFVSIGQQIGVSIENARLFEEERQARQEAEKLAGENAELLAETKRAYEELSITQHRLIEAEKRAAVVELAGAAAHELRQPLTCVVGNVDLLMDESGLQGKARQALLGILEGAHRMEQILRKLGEVTRYATKPYVGDVRIIDLDQASTPDPIPPRSSDGC
jgi:GAF domain-containing protein